jgi:hypothetical protein
MNIYYIIVHIMENLDIQWGNINIFHDGEELNKDFAIIIIKFF